MAKEVICAVSFEKEKIYFNEKFNDLPEGIKLEIKELCAYFSQKLECLFIAGMNEKGDVCFETVCEGVLADFDDIGAELEIKRIFKEKKELIKALKLWFQIFKTPDGEKIKEKLIKERNLKGF